MENDKILIFIPTYNERDNVEKMCDELINLKLEADILFLDDNSPDGTGKILNELADKYKQVNVIHRNNKSGIGSAHQYGIKWAYDNHYNKLITMDCDFTHNPSHITDMLDKSKDYDVVITSRYVLKDSLEEWNLIRKILTLTGHFLTTLLLKMPYDASGAFRLYNINRIPHNVFDVVSSLSYSFFFESLYILHLNKFSITEIPIKLPARTYGHSKMAFKDVLGSLKLLIGIYLNTLFNKEKFEISATSAAKSVLSKDVIISSDWENYWKNQKNTSGLIYDAIAAFYRKYIIKRTLNHFVTKYFHHGAKVIHAGCGGGQVDVEIRHKISIIALDISINALNFYKKVNKNYCELLHGSIFSIPLPNESVEGIYNLGVMEHFDEKDIHKILQEFYRVLKSKGRMIIFWPPEFGMTVIFFKILTFIFVNILSKENVKFHPDELTRIKSKKHVIDIFEMAHFKVIDYYFGIKDMFTYSIIVVEK